MYTEYLYHSGIQGMKWGIRRYQNPDGTWTEAGKARYGHSSSIRSEENYRPKGAMVDGPTKESLKRDEEWRRKHGSVENLSSTRDENREIKKARKEAKKQIREDAKNRHNMSDDELDEKIKRLRKEKELKDLTDRDVNEGKVYTKELLKDVGKRTVPAIATVGVLYGGKKAVEALAKSEAAREFVGDVYKYAIKKK